MNKIYIGIDPGQKGAIVVFIPGQDPILNKMPLVEGDLNLEKLMEYIDPGSYDCHIVIEDVHSVFGASAAANFSFGFGCGQLFATLKLSGIPFTQVAPKMWQKEMWQGVHPVMVLDGKKKNKDGSPKYKVDTKATSLLAAMRLFPGISFKEKKIKEYYKDTYTNRKLARAGKEIIDESKDHDGIVDALLIAEYGRRKNF
jgi:hypothetical protein